MEAAAAMMELVATCVSAQTSTLVQTVILTLTNVAVLPTLA